MSKLVTNWITSEVMASQVVSGAKKVYPVDRSGMGADSVTDQALHAPVKQTAMPAQNTMDPRQERRNWLRFARQIQQEKKCDWTRAWIQASTEHPELINSDSDGGPSKPVTGPDMKRLPGSDASAVTATFKRQSCRVVFTNSSKGPRTAIAVDSCPMTQDEIAAFNRLPNEERLRLIFGIDVDAPVRAYCDVRLPFGKYHGRRFDNVPVSYLYWMRDNLKDIRPWLRQAIDGYSKSFGLD
jgi:hypothetical protein